METGEEAFRLVHLFDDVRAYNIPHAASAGRSAGWQCLRWGTESAGSSGVVTEDGELEATGHTNKVCKEWVFVVGE